SIARRPHNSPAHTVKDQPLATDFSMATQDLSSWVSRPFYIVFYFSQQRWREFLAKRLSRRTFANRLFVEGE
ncbi:MAG TPA: hypothetical protein VGC19_11355, partial [Rhodanobacter sp.]